jgi:hypothetical protein
MIHSYSRWIVDRRVDRSLGANLLTEEDFLMQPLQPDYFAARPASYKPASTHGVCHLFVHVAETRRENFL